MIIPDKTSSTFLSFIGNLDKRVELDSTIKHADGNYNALLSMMASKVSYENKAYIETTVKDHWEVNMFTKNQNILFVKKKKEPKYLMKTM